MGSSFCTHIGDSFNLIIFSDQSQLSSQFEKQQPEVASHCLSHANTSHQPPPPSRITPGLLQLQVNKLPDLLAFFLTATPRLKRIFTFKDVNTLCVWGVFVWVVGRREEPSFRFLHPRSTLTCRLHSRVVFHWNMRSIKDKEVKSEGLELWSRGWAFRESKMHDCGRWRFTCCILPCCPRQPKYEKTCNNCKTTKKQKIHFWWCVFFSCCCLWCVHCLISAGGGLSQSGFHVLYTNAMLMLKLSRKQHTILKLVTTKSNFL